MALGSGCADLVYDFLFEARVQPNLNELLGLLGLLKLLRIRTSGALLDVGVIPSGRAVHGSHVLILPEGIAKSCSRVEKVFR